MRWSLFEQSHEKTFDRFLSAPAENNAARWFVLLCQRGHSFELKDEAKEQWVCLDAQGSLSRAGTGKIYINKDSPVGRFLDPKIEWGKVYLVELLISKMPVGETLLHVVLDSGGLHNPQGQQ